MWFQLLYTDLVEWTGEDIASSPVQDVIKLIVVPRVGEKMVVSGWDHYGVTQAADRVRVIRWKDDDATDADGVPDLFAGKGAYHEWIGKELTYSSPYMSRHDLPQPHTVRHGRWVEDNIARLAGIL